MRLAESEIRAARRAARKWAAGVVRDTLDMTSRGPVVPLRQQAEARAELDRLLAALESGAPLPRIVRGR